jgi:phosphate transport system substrate-binding protein
MQKTFLVTAILLSALVSCKRDSKEELTIGKKHPSNKHIVIRGSETIKPIILAAAETFILLHPDYSFSIECKGSGSGISALITKDADIALSSRDLKGSERFSLNKHNCKMNMNIVAMDALSIVTNINNSVSQLSRNQLADIFSGKIRNWEDVGGEDLPIIVLLRDQNSGTAEFFKNKILIDQTYSPEGKVIAENEEIVQSIQDHKGAIAFLGLGLIDETAIKPLKISFENNGVFYEPNFEGILQDKYPLSRPLFYIYSSENEVKVAPFVNFLLSKEGQEIVLHKGFLPLYN